MVDQAENGVMVIAEQVAGLDDRQVEIKSIARMASSRTTDCAQKNDPQRLPRVTGSTRCRLEEG